MSRRSLFGLLVLVLAVMAAQGWWRSQSEQRIGRAVAALAQPGDIRMLASTTCGSCALARAWFRAHEVAFSECFIDRDPVCLADFQATRSPGTPVLLVRGQAQVGFDAQRVRLGLQRQGG